jgi:hypothetical protein
MPLRASDSTVSASRPRPRANVTRREVMGGALLAAAGIALAAGTDYPAVLAGSASPAASCDRDEDAPGLIGDNAWQGPFYGLGVEWEPVRWTLAERSNRWVARSIGREDKPIDCGFGQGASDRLMLVDGMWESGVFMIESYDRLMWTPDSMADAMTQPGWVQNLRVAAGSPLLIAEAKGNTLVAVAGDDETPGHTVYWQATFPEDDESVIHNLTLHMWEAGAVYALHDLEGITIAGIDPFAVVDLDTVRAAIDAYLEENRDPATTTTT